MPEVLELDDELQAQLLAYITEPRASSCNSSWKDYLYKSLQIKQQAKFKQEVHESGTLIFCYNAVRPLAEDFEESVHYNFKFMNGGTYTMQWTRTFDAWSSQSEQHYGSWQLGVGQVLCETLQPLEEPAENQVRFAPAGYKFTVPLEDILDAQGGYFQAPLGAPPAPWEDQARLGKTSNRSSAGWVQWEETQTPSPHDSAARSPLRPDTRFCEIDGDMVEVSGDIVANWPEEEWPRLMRCRLRFGIMG